MAATAWEWIAGVVAWLVGWFAYRDCEEEDGGGLLASIYSTYIIALGASSYGDIHFFALHLHLHVLARFLREKEQGLLYINTVQSSSSLKEYCCVDICLFAPRKKNILRVTYIQFMKKRQAIVST